MYYLLSVFLVAMAIAGAWGDAVVATPVKEAVPTPLLTVWDYGRVWQQFDPTASFTIFEISRDVASRLSWEESICAIVVADQLSQPYISPLSNRFLWNICLQRQRKYGYSDRDLKTSAFKSKR